MTTIHKVLFPFVLVCLAVVAWMVITNHAYQSHTTEAWSSIRVLEQFKKQGGKDCVKLEVAACPKNPTNEGFTVRAYCETPDSHIGIMGIWGYGKEGIYVTGYRVDYGRWLSTCKRDGCWEADITLLSRVLK